MHSQSQNRAINGAVGFRPRSVNRAGSRLPSRGSRRFILGITGNIACGKSVVAGLFRTKGCLLIDADKMAHGLLADGGLKRKIKGYFGNEILRANGDINRKKLGQIVFANPAALTRLNSILHPELIRLLKKRISSTDKKIIILDAPLIIEARLTKLVDKLVVVTAKRQQQILRAVKNLGLTKKQVVLRMKSQISQSAKSRFADFIIDNSGHLSQTQKQVVKIRRQLWKS